MTSKQTLAPPTLLDKAIPLGKGRAASEVYYIDTWPLSYFDKQGNSINPWVNDEFVDPTTLPGYDHKEITPLQAGKLQILPTWDEGLLRVMVAMEEFARPDMQAQIDGWLARGLESHELIAKVKEAGGLLGLKDIGLEPVGLVAAMPGTVNESGG